MAKLFTIASSQYMTVNSAVVTAAPFSVSCWYRPASIGAVQTLLSVGDVDVTNEQWRLNINTIGRARWSAQTSAGEASATYTGAAMSAGVWGHVGGVEASATSHTAYLNGSSSTNTNSRAPAGADTLRIGTKASSTPVDYADGDIAEVGIWNIGLTAAEMAILAAGYSPLFVRPESLVFYMPLLREDVELSGGLALTPVNSPTVSDHPRVLLPSRPYYSLPAAGGGTTYNMIATLTAVSATPNDPALAVLRATAATLTGATSASDTPALAVLRGMTAVQTAVTATPDDPALAVLRALAATLTAATSTSDDPALAIARSMTAALTAVSATSDDPALAILRVMTAAHTAVSATPDNPALSILRAMTASLTAVTITPDIDLLIAGLIQLVATITAASNTSDSPALAILRTMTASPTAASATPDDPALAILRSLGAVLTAVSNTSDDAAVTMLRSLTATLAATSATSDDPALAVLRQMTATATGATNTPAINLLTAVIVGLIIATMTNQQPVMTFTSTQPGATMTSRQPTVAIEGES